MAWSTSRPGQTIATGDDGSASSPSPSCWHEGHTSKYFASHPRSHRRRAAKPRRPQATTLAALRDELIARGGTYAQSLAHGKAVRMALDQVMSDEAAALREGSEVAFFPPVTGG